MNRLTRYNPEYLVAVTARLSADDTATDHDPGRPPRRCGVFFVLNLTSASDRPQGSYESAIRH